MQLGSQLCSWLRGCHIELPGGGRNALEIPQSRFEVVKEADKNSFKYIIRPVRYRFQKALLKAVPKSARAMWHFRPRGRGQRRRGRKPPAAGPTAYRVPTLTLLDIPAL